MTETDKERADRLEAEVEFWKKDAAAAWDKCEERRLQAETAEAENARLRELVDDCLADMKRYAADETPDRMLVSWRGYSKARAALGGTKEAENAKVREALERLVEADKNRNQFRGHVALRAAWDKARAALGETKDD
jgi:hypothetical protein